MMEQDILRKAEKGADLTQEEALILLEQRELNIIKVIQEIADHLRFQQVGDVVTYVINRNVNFTNICEQHCNFCAFRRDAGQEGAFWLNLEEIMAKVADAIARNATEICMQGGLNPHAKIQGSSLNYYRQIVSKIKEKYEELHLHAFSPQEIEFIAREDGLSYEYVIKSLQEAGVNSIPGTAAEVLNNDIRRIICPEKISREIWLEIVSIAHRCGIPTTSTIMSGHIETPKHQIEHLSLLRLLQQKAIKEDYSAKITEFIILPFVGQQAPLSLRKRVGRDQPDLNATLLLTAVSRIFLGNWIVNHQPSWVKLGLKGATEALKWGCNDIGGTLMEEHITTMAGAQGGSNMSVETLQEAITSVNRPYRQRNTLYS